MRTPRNRQRRITPNIVHGTRTGYTNHGCRCDDCLKANSDGQRVTRRLQAFGRYDKYVDAKVVRDHLLILNANHISTRRVAGLVGMTNNGLNDILMGHTKRALRTTADKVLAIQPDPFLYATETSRLPATGVRRRLQALYRMGWNMTAMAGECGINRWNLRNWMLGEWRFIQKPLYDQICAMYDNLWDRDGGDTKARRAAAARGYALPMAWDDDTIDNEDAMPDSGKHTRYESGQFENLEWLLKSGVGWFDACRRAGYQSLHSVKRAAARAGRMDLVSGLPDPSSEAIIFQKSA